LIEGSPEIMQGPVLLNVMADRIANAAVRANEDVVHDLLAAFNAGDLAALDRIVAADFIDHTPLPGLQSDREGLKQAVTQFRAAFGDAHWSAEQLVANHDTIAARLTFRGTHRGEILGIPPTGQPVEIGGVAIYRISGGHVMEEWASRDLFGLKRQLGAIPSAAP
jgi:steroid delta-isomerase-like uncharacterized protein